RSKLIWGFGFNGYDGRLRELALEAFYRTWERMRSERLEAMDPAERERAEAAFARAHAMFVETGEERQSRLLREEVASLRARLEALEAKGHGTPVAGLSPLVDQGQG